MKPPSRHPRLRALAAGLLALAAAAVPSSAADLAVTSTPASFAPDSAGATSLSHYVNLREDADWFGPDFRLISFLDGDMWVIDNPLNLGFTGASGTLHALAPGALVDSSLSFIETGFLTPGDWTIGAPQLLGFHREVDGADFFGALLLRYEPDRSFSLLQFGIAEGVFDPTGLMPVPEPAAITFAALASGLGAMAWLRSRRTRR